MKYHRFDAPTVVTRSKRQAVDGSSYIVLHRLPLRSAFIYCQAQSKSGQLMMIMRIVSGSPNLMKSEN